MSARDILDIKRRHEEYLLGVKGVTGVGVNGSIIIYVERITPELSRVLPKELEGVAVHVKETGRVRLLSIIPMEAVFADRVGRYRPAPGGVSVGHPSTTAGTLACRVLDSKSREVIGGLTNNHIAALDWGIMHTGKLGDSVLQPGPYDGGVEPDDKIGELLKWVPVEPGKSNLVDAAIFSSEELRKDVLEVGNPSHTVEPRVGMKVVKSGRSSGVNYGTITDINATIQVDGGEGWGEVIFADQIIIEPSILIPGDSGSWIGSVDNFASVGLGFAGSEALAVANRALLVEELLDIEIIPPAQPMRLSSAVAFWLGVLGIGLQVGYGGGKA